MRETAIVAGVAACYALLMAAMFRYAAARMPAGIVRRLFRTGRPVTLVISSTQPNAWDPTRPLSGLYEPGTVTYTLAGSTSVHILFQPRAGGPSRESTTVIPAQLLPDTPETRRRRTVARIVISLYLVMGLATFLVVDDLVAGSASVRARIAALTALGAVAVTWLITHMVLTRKGERSTDLGRSFVHSHHIAAWTSTVVVLAVVLGVAWHLGNENQEHPMSWASSFLSSGIFALVSVAALTASLHHHTYIHHSQRRGEHPADRR